MITSQRLSPARSTLLTSCLGLVTICFGASAQNRIVVADWRVEAGRHSATPLQVVGAGRANEGLRADWQQQLSQVQSEIGFGYLRMHGLLNDEMGVYTEKRDGTPVYNFQNIDVLYDALLARHIRPFVEVAFMPGALASGKQTIFWWHGNVTPPKDAAKWQSLIRALLDHWRERYGEAEIAKWYFEVWNEPDLNAFFTGTLDEYLNLYRETAVAIKSECPACRVGGPASAMPYRYEQAFVAFCAANHVPVDFLSSHSYGVDKGFLDASGETGTRLSANPLVVSDRMRHSRDLLNHSALPKLALHFTEWSSAYTATDPLHDQYIQAAFLLEQVRGAVDAVDSMSYWTFTDIFEENGPPKTPFHGGFGLLNLQGIRKPAYFAYRYLAQLGETDLRVADAHAWVTKSANGRMAALLWNYQPVLPPAKENDQMYFAREVQPTSLPPVTLSLINVPAGDYMLTVHRTGYEHNDPYDAYLRMGSPSQLSRLQVDELKAKSRDEPVESTTIHVDSAGKFERAFAMRTNDLYLITLTAAPRIAE